MVTLNSRFGYSTHALERGLERVFEFEPPYSTEQLDHMREYLKKFVTWNQFTSKFVLDEYNIELVIVGNSVVTLIVVEDKGIPYKKVGEFMKANPKKTLRMGKTRNGKSRYKSKSHD
jgi:hypothetical protein